MDAVLQQIPDRAEFVRRYNAELFSAAGAHPVGCLCGSTRSRKLFDKDRYGLRSPTVVCRDCGLVFTSPRPSEAFMQSFYKSDTYRFFYEEAGSSDLAVRLAPKYKSNNFIHATCSKYLRPELGCKSRVLELGAGGGWNLVPFQATSDVIGIDYSPILCDLGRTHGMTMIQGGLERLVDASPECDLIILNHVVEHFFDFVGSMKILMSRLSGDGIIYVGVPDIYFYDISQIQNAHNYYFSPATLAHYCAMVGLGVLDSGKDDSGLHQYAVLRRFAEAPAAVPLKSEYRTIIRKRRAYAFKSTVGGLLARLGLWNGVKRVRGFLRRR